MVLVSILHTGKNMIIAMTIDGMTHCTRVGRRHDQDEFAMCRFVPYVVHPARMLPTHQKLLYMPAMVPR